MQSRSIAANFGCSFGETLKGHRNKAGRSAAGHLGGLVGFLSFPPLRLFFLVTFLGLSTFRTRLAPMANKDIYLWKSGETLVQKGLQIISFFGGGPCNCANLTVEGLMQFYPLYFILKYFWEIICQYNHKETVPQVGNLVWFTLIHYNMVNPVRTFQVCIIFPG